VNIDVVEQIIWCFDANMDATSHVIIRVAL
jgi:hypothetical protein